MIDEVIFDVETQKLFSEVAGGDPALLGVSLVSVYIRKVDEEQRELSGEMRSFWEHEIANFWPLLAGVTRIIGFNSLKFDVPVLAPYAPATFTRFAHFDIMASVREKLGHNLSLAVLATQTLGAGKTDNGANAVEYWKSQDPTKLAKLKAYCEADVLLTRDLYDYGVRNKHLKYRDKWNNPKSFPVDFSYPKEVIDASRQMGMF
ncbi:ribonuclease H-like domain-containing protein [Candidatus Gottesmanbacteria bacterium]|nr:ribonuclease H-like domain-containing protein [Candidatus Gottesmanbacteria bacterium]